MDPKSIQGKWVAEVFDLLRLFRFVERSFSGFLIVLAIWSLFLGLVFKPLAASETGGVYNPVPWLYGGEKLRLIEVWVAGTAAISCWWVLRSEAYHLVLGPALRLGRAAGLVLAWAVYFCWKLVELVWLIVATPVATKRIHRHREQLGAEKVAELDADYPLSDHWGFWADLAGFNPAWADAWVVRFLAHLMAPGGRVGFAPFVSLTYLEEMQASKAYPQALTWALDRLEDRIRPIPQLRRVRLTPLPGFFAVRHRAMAQFVRWLFRCDVVIWGSYQSPEDGTLWLNLDLPPTRQDEKEQKDFEKEGGTDKFSEQLFEYERFRRLPSMTVDQSAPTEVYAVLLISVFVLLRQRNEKPRRGMFGYDPLRYSSSTADRVWQILLDDVFNRWSDPLREGFFSPVSLAVARLVGDWVGSQINMLQGTVSEDVLRRCLDLAARCARLLPGDPRCWYRLGALECAVGSVDAALAHFRRAGEAEAGHGRSSAFKSCISIDLEVGINGADPSDLVFARIAAHAAVVANVGRAYDVRSAERKVGELTGGVIYRLLPHPRHDTIRDLIRRMLGEAKLAHVQRLAAQFWEEEGRPTGREADHWHRAEAAVNRMGGG